MNVFRYSVRMTMLALILLVFIGGWLLVPDRGSDQDVIPLPMTEDQVVLHYYAPLVPMEIADVSVQASIASTLEERQQGLSGTPYLPDDIVKLFIFDEVGDHGIWMKDMNYSIDILWLDEAGMVVHIEHEADPSTYINESEAEIFRSAVPSRYVIETVAGFVEQHAIAIGTQTSLPF